MVCAGDLFLGRWLRNTLTSFSKLMATETTNQPTDDDDDGDGDDGDGDGDGDDDRNVAKIDDGRWCEMNTESDEMGNMQTPRGPDSAIIDGSGHG